MNGDLCISIEDATMNSTDIRLRRLMIRNEETHSIILDCSQFAYIDSMGVTALASVSTDYDKDSAVNPLIRLFV